MVKRNPQKKEILNKSNDDNSNNSAIPNIFSNYQNISRDLNVQSKVNAFDGGSLGVTNAANKTADRVKEENFYNSLSNFIPNDDDEDIEKL